jgi:hypothetical protein
MTDPLPTNAAAELIPATPTTPTPAPAGARNSSFSCGPVLNSSNRDVSESPPAAAAQLALPPRSASW